MSRPRQGQLKTSHLVSSSLIALYLYYNVGGGGVVVAEQTGDVVDDVPEL